MAMHSPKVRLPERMNAAAVFVDGHVEAGRGGRTAVLCSEDRWNYVQVKELMDRVAAGLRSLGVRREERVLLLLPDGPHFAACFFGTMKLGAVAVPLSTLLTPDDYLALLEDSGGAVLVTTSDLYKKIEPIRRAARHLRNVIATDASPAGCIDFDEWTRSADAVIDPEDTSKDDAAFWLYSSGTTGRPKAAVHLHHDMVVAADLYALPTLRLGPDDVCFSVAKLFFAYGLGNGLYFPFRVGAAAVHLPGRPTPEAVFAAIDRHRPTVFYSVPTSYAALLAHAEERGIASLGRVRIAVSAGEQLPAAIFRRWSERFGVEVLDGIGSTEILHIFISNRIGRARAGSTGEIVPGYEARIVGADGRELPPGEIGDLLIKGDSICSEYWNRHEETKRTILGEWIRTGDKFHVDRDGYFYFHGRGDDMLKVSGYWVSPAEVEAALIEHPAVLECGVVGRSDADELTKPFAYVVPREGREPSSGLADELKTFLRGRLAPYKIPKWIEFVAALPKTPTGKVQRYRLRAQAARQIG